MGQKTANGIVHEVIPKVISMLPPPKELTY